jgi:hypothetical protein
MPISQRAIGWKLLLENPCKHVELPVWNRQEASYLTPEQTRDFLAAARSDAMIDLTYSHVPRKVEQAAADRLAAMLYGT